MNKISSVTHNLGEAYRQWKASEKEKNEYKNEFFELAEEETPESLAQEVQRIYGPTTNEAVSRAQEQFPSWRVKDCEPIEDTQYFTVLLEEDPKYRPYSYVNAEDKMVYTKQVTSGAPYLDDERLKATNPSLYEQVTYEKRERRLRSLDELTPEQMAEVQEFIFEGKPTIKLAPPRKAKPEELEPIELVN